MYLKMSKDSSAKYYQDNKEKRQYICEQNRILSEDEKQKLAQKKKCHIIIVLNCFHLEHLVFCWAWAS